MSTVQAAAAASRASNSQSGSESQASEGTAEEASDNEAASSSNETIADEGEESDSMFEEGPQSSGSEPDADQIGMSESSSDESGDVVFTFSPNPTTDEFIDSIAEQARTIADENNLYASVIIAQAILESGSGSSSLSKAPNYNLFGIKGDYNGSSVTFWTAEDDGSGNCYMIQSAFRAYPSVEESLRDYAALLTSSYYVPYVLKSETASYVDVCDYLQGRYATSMTYSAKLQAIIDAYDLTQYDQPADASDDEEVDDEDAEEAPVEEAAVAADAAVRAPTPESPAVIDEEADDASDDKPHPSPLAMAGVPAILAIALESVNLARRVRARRSDLDHAQHAQPAVSGDDTTEKIAPVDAADPADPLN